MDRKKRDSLMNMLNEGVEESKAFKKNKMSESLYAGRDVISSRIPWK